MNNVQGFSFLNVVVTKPEWHGIVPSILSQACQKIDLADKGTLDVLEDVIFEMYRTLYLTVGVGLAAPQVGIPWRLAVLDTRNKTHQNDGKILLINPEIIEHSREENMANAGESCLSIPFYNGTVPRYEKITVKNYTLLGETQIIEADGFLARVIQHEMDHLDGITYLNKIDVTRDLDQEPGAHIARHAKTAIEKLKVNELIEQNLLKGENN